MKDKSIFKKQLTRDTISEIKNSGDDIELEKKI